MILLLIRLQQLDKRKAGIIMALWSFNHKVELNVEKTNFKLF